jgi:hypothetical protein
MWKIFSVPCGSALYKFHCILKRSVGYVGIQLRSVSGTIFPWTSLTSITVLRIVVIMCRLIYILLSKCYLDYEVKYGELYSA